MKFKSKKQITIAIQDTKFNIFNSVYISLADRIIFFEDESEVLTQYSNSSWDISTINDVANSFENHGIERLYGYNK